MFDIKSVKLRSEEEIVSSWVDNKQIKVSVLCSCYNHEAFIEDAIKGFLIQETDFAFEVIIHDDASTDSTASIVREFQAKYPRIIKPIFQTENQYSKGGFKPAIYAASFAKGEFIALCEGDDYWISSQKLQTQICFLTENTDFSLHVFDAYEQNDKEPIPPTSSKRKRLNILPGDYTQDKLNKTFVLFPLTSCFRNILKEKKLPGYFYKSINGDQLLQLILAQYGKAHVSPCSPKAVYRLHNKGVWSKKDSCFRFYENSHTFLVKSRYFSELNNIELKNEYLLQLCEMTLEYIGFKSIFKKMLILKIRNAKNIINGFFCKIKNKF